MRRKSGFRIQGETLQTFAKVLAGTGAGALVILTSYRILGADWWETGSSWSGLGLLIITAVITSGVILGLYGWMKVEAVSIILNRGGREINEDS